MTIGYPSPQENIETEFKLKDFVMFALRHPDQSRKTRNAIQYLLDTNPEVKKQFIGVVGTVEMFTVEKGHRTFERGEHSY